MAKMVFSADNKFTHDILGDGAMVATLDLAKMFPKVVEAGGIAYEALKFAVKTASRNATAGLLSSDKPAYDPKEAFNRVQQRFAAWESGTWRAASEAAGEPRTSLLARAVAKALNIEPEKAAEDISAAIDAALDEKGLSRDEEGDKAAVRKIGNEIRAAIREEVKPIYEELKLEEQQKRVEASKAEAKTEPGKLAGLLKR